MPRLVIRDPSCGLYAQAWYSAPFDHSENIHIRTVWVSKEHSSTFRSRKEANEVITSLSPELQDIVQVEPR